MGNRLDLVLKAIGDLQMTLVRDIGFYGEFTITLPPGDYEQLIDDPRVKAQTSSNELTYYGPMGLVLIKKGTKYT